MPERLGKMNRLSSKAKFNQKGAQNKALEMARAFKQKGIDIGIIAETSGIPVEQVARL